MTHSFISRRRADAQASFPVGGLFLARSADTGGAVECAISALGPGEGPPLHLHPDQDEALYVMEGRLCLQVEGAAHTLRAGDFAFIPSGVLHTLATAGGRAHVVHFFTPGGLAAFCSDVLEADRAALADAGACFASKAQPAIGLPLRLDHIRALRPAGAERSSRPEP